MYLVTRRVTVHLNISADLTYSRRLSAVLRKDRILFLFFKGRDGAVITAITEVVKATEAIPNVHIRAAGAIRVVAATARAVIATKGRSRIEARETVFSRTKLLKFA